MAALSAPGWLVRFVPRPQARLRLICFPHAGGTALAFFRWARRLPEDIEVVAVQYPGRAERRGHPMPGGMRTLVAGVRAAVAPVAEQGPYAFFGHSMGAAVAYETALALRASGVPGPEHLLVSGRSHQGPDLPESSDDQEAAMRLIQRLGGTSPALLDDAETRKAILAMVTADWRLLESYRPSLPEPPLSLPVTAMTGSHDPITEVDGMHSWSRVTGGPFALNVFPGGHFYLDTAIDEVIAHITVVLRA